MGKAKIVSIGVAVPEHKISQKSYLNYFLRSSSTLPSSERLIKTICHKSGIEQRYSVLSDFTMEIPANQTYKASIIDKPGIGKRMAIYEEKALDLAIKAVKECFKNREGINKDKISHLITFSCTGMYAPGIDIGIVEAFDLKKDIERTSINFMGCYAAIVALKSAYHIVRSSPKSQVLLVGVELCSIHHNTLLNTEQMIANAIFGDGAASVLVTGKDIGNGICLEMNKFYSMFSSDGKNDMTWKIGADAFELYLSSYVPKLLDKGLEEITNKLLSKTKLDKNDIDYYAIHPGGMAILQACEKALNLTGNENKYSYKVLQNYGNMSSVTVLFVLNEIMQSLTSKDKGKNMLSFAFGPGLTIESMSLKVK